MRGHEFTSVHTQVLNQTPRVAFTELRFAREMGDDPSYTSLCSNKAKEEFRSRWAAELQSATKTTSKTQCTSKEESANSKRKYKTKSQLELHYNNTMTACKHVRFCIDHNLTRRNEMAGEQTYLLIDLAEMSSSKRLAEMAETQQDQQHKHLHV